MNVNVEKLITLLREGEFRKCYKYMGKIDEFGLECNCVMGIACRLYQAEVGGLEVYVDKYGIKYWDGQCVAMPEKVRKWYGFRTRNGASTAGSLPYLNDSMNLTFSEIANIIESEPEGLFVQEK